MNKSCKPLSAGVYFLGCAIVALCVFTIIFESAFPENSCGLPILFYLVVGTAPMLLASVAFYHSAGLNTGAHKKRNFALVFLPAFVCGASLLYYAGVIVWAVIRAALKT
jgi:hypothetical protein